MSYKIEISDIVRKTLRKMDSTARKQVLSYVSGVLARIDNPRLLGKALTGNFGGFWRYRTGNFRIICKIDLVYFDQNEPHSGRPQIHDHLDI